jgi:hypothetical protein
VNRIYELVFGKSPISAGKGDLIAKSTQKTNVCKGVGGIQKGHTAWSAQGTKLDKQVRLICRNLLSETDHWYRGHTKKSPIFDNIQQGCVPDGGIWMDDTGVRLVVEAKVQGSQGNAIERHSTNFMICDAHKSKKKFMYITFMAGEGAQQGNVLHKHANDMMMCRNKKEYQNINIIHPEGLSFFLSPDGWTDDEIENIMVRALNI